MNTSIAEQRRETRRQAQGNVLVRSENAGSRNIQGKLVDVSASGFRMEHDCAELTAGQYVAFTHIEARGRARVVWTRILDDSVESGFVIAD
ncbi:MAG TPA: PilZ domain-containing protein [Burkholderiales bacterium]|jgi:hypothetical protein|nr:PilZ domain-containing protein [Burkholderiales bacterium]